MTKTIKEALTRTGLEGCLTQWAVSMLRTRITQSVLGSSRLIRAVNRDTLYGGVIPLLVCLIMMGEFILDRSLVKVVTYAGGVPLSGIMEGALKKMRMFVARYELGINPTETECMLFTIKKRIPKFYPPRLSEQRFAPRI